MSAAAASTGLFDASTDEDAAGEQTIGWFSGPTKFTTQERVHFTSQLAMMTGAGVAVSSALQSIARQTQKASLKRVVEQVNEDVLGGASFSVALRKHPGLCDEAYAATISAGEASGRMSDVLAELAELQRAELRLQRSIRGMLIYPVLLTVVSILVISILVVFVLPKFASIFEQYDITLPLVTRGLMGLADELRNRWWLWGPLGGAGVAGLVALRVTPTGRRLFDTFMLTAPGLKPLTQLLIGARSCRLFGLLVEAGVPMLDCLLLLKSAISNCVFRDLATRLEDAVMNGRTLSEALEGNEVLPPSATELFATAEKTGRLGEVARMMGTHYDEEGQTAARQMISVIEPIVTIVMGAVVAVVVLAVMLPVFDIATISKR